MVPTISSQVYYNPSNICNDGQKLAKYVMSRNCHPYLVISSYSAVFVALCHPNYFAQTLSSHLAAMPIESEQPNLIPSW